MNKDKVIHEYLPLVKSFANKYSELGLLLEDLVQEGLIGLHEATSHFDETKGTKFSTYASYWIKKRMLSAIQAEKKTSMNSKEFEENFYLEESAKEDIQISLTIPADFPEIEKKVLQLLYNDEKTLNEIAETLDISREKTRQLKEKALRRLKVTK